MPKCAICKEATDISYNGKYVCLLHLLKGLARSAYKYLRQFGHNPPNHIVAAGGFTSWDCFSFLCALVQFQMTQYSPEKDSFCLDFLFPHFADDQADDVPRVLLALWPYPLPCRIRFIAVDLGSAATESELSRAQARYTGMVLSHAAGIRAANDGRETPLILAFAPSDVPAFTLCQSALFRPQFVRLSAPNHETTAFAGVTTVQPLRSDGLIEHCTLCCSGASGCPTSVLVMNSTSDANESELKLDSVWDQRISDCSRVMGQRWNRIGSYDAATTALLLAVNHGSSTSYLGHSVSSCLGKLPDRDEENVWACPECMCLTSVPGQICESCKLI